MNEVDIRALVREAVARHFGPQAPPTPASVAPRAAAIAPSPLAGAPVGAGTAVHASHVLYLSLVNTSDACVIEPSVACDHCGYCKSHGH